MSPKYTPEPWKADGWDLWHVGVSYTDPQDPHLFTGITTHKGCLTPEATANLARIVACVNLLAPHPDLAGVEVVRGEVMKAVRDALERLARCVGHPNPDKRERKDCELRAIATEALGLLGRGPQ